MYKEKKIQTFTENALVEGKESRRKKMYFGFIRDSIRKLVKDEMETVGRIRERYVCMVKH